MRTMVRNMMQDTIWVTVLQGLNYLIPLFVWPYLIVVLGAEGFGVVGFAMAFMQFLMLVVDFGFNLTATKQIATATSQESIDTISSATLYAKALLFGLAVIIGAVVLCLPQFAPYRIAVAVLLPMLFSSVFSMQWLYQGTGNIRRLWILNSACRLVIIPLTFVIVKSAADVLPAVGIQSAAYFVSAIVGLVWALKHGLFVFRRTTWQAVRERLKDSFPLFVSTATSSVYAMLLVVVLGYFASTQEVGLYSAVEKMMRVACYALLLPALQVCYPQISKLAATDRKSALRMVRVLCGGLAVLMGIIGCVLFFGGEQLMALMGKDYGGSAQLFRIMAFIPVLVTISGVYGQLDLLAIGGERQKWQFRNVYLLGASVAVVLVVCFIPGLTTVITAHILCITEAVVASGMLLFAILRHRE